MLISVALVLGCACLSWIELKYGLTGQTTTATVIRSEPYVVHGRSFSRRAALTYQFTDATGDTRTDIDDILLNNEKAPTVGSAITVEYIPGCPGESRLLGHNYLLAITFCLILFVGGLVCLAFYCAMIVTDTPSGRPELLT